MFFVVVVFFFKCVVGCLKFLDPKSHPGESQFILFYLFCCAADYILNHDVKKRIDLCLTLTIFPCFPLFHSQKVCNYPPVKPFGNGEWIAKGQSQLHREYMHTENHSSIRSPQFTLWDMPKIGWHMLQPLASL